ncbi:iron-sulfur cluster-binding protein [archaeon]|nr:iron-sulfur cluster-binding protein [archaeon]
MVKPVVAVMKTSPNTVVNDYGTLMDLAKYKNFLKKKYETLLKLNLSWSLFYPACSTPPWQLDGVLKKLQKDGYKNLHPVENKTVVTKPWLGAKQNKWLPILKRYNTPFEPLTDVEWVRYKPKFKSLAIEELFHGHWKIPKMFLGKNVIQMCTKKTHGHTQMTGSIKNAFGGLITERRHHSHKVIDEILVDLLRAQQDIHSGIFAVMDGTVCGNGAGPRTMEPVIKNYILGSGDCVAIDSIAAKMMGFDPMKIGHLKLAHDQGLGCADVSQIEVVGENISNVNFKFHTKKSPVIFFDQTLRKKYPVFEPLLFHSPLFKLCILGSAWYHDKLWYPTIGKRKVNAYLKTEWGQLFKKY